MLSVEHVTKKYGKFTALEDVSLTFTPGVYGLLAPNGAGKTTLIKMLTTLLFPTSGQILWNGEDIHALDEAYRGLLGYLPQEFGYYPHYSPRQFLRYGIHTADKLRSEHQHLHIRQLQTVFDLFRRITEIQGHGHAARLQYPKIDGQPFQTVHHQNTHLRLPLQAAA